MSVRGCLLWVLCDSSVYSWHSDIDLFPDHIGVARAFLDAKLMPRVHSGTSAGGVLAALICTRTDEELRGLLVPELARRISAFEEPFSVWGKRVWKTGARFDGVHWARKV